MRITAPATEDEVITAILEAELPMKRHDYKYAKVVRELPNHTVPEGFFTRPAHSDLRYKVLQAGRGWPDKQLFRDFPKCDWDWAVLEQGDMISFDYIRYDYWDALSGGTHRVVDGAAAVAAGNIIYEQPNQAFWDVERLTRQGKRFPPLVLLRSHDTGRLTVVEGHTRATGFALAGVVPEGQTAIVGTPRRATDWNKEQK